MGAKHEVLKALEQHRGQTISGEKLADKLNISRNAVWKAIQQLRKEGYEISAATNKGYSLSDDNDWLSSEGIGLYLQKSDLQIYTHKTMESTNITAKKLALEGAKHGTVILSEEQTRGRGRRGRSFFSPTNSGIYMSIILRPQTTVENSLLITVAASVAVARAIEAITGIYAQIKWVNDIFVKEKKVCGILTEAVTDFESGGIEYVVVGIGLNFTTKQSAFPPEISELAGSLFEENSKGVSRNHLVAEIINNLLALVDRLTDREFMAEYKSRSLLLQKDIQIVENGRSTDGRSTNARVLDIDENGFLVVKYPDGTIAKLNSGEVRRIV